MFLGSAVTQIMQRSHRFFFYILPPFKVKLVTGDFGQEVFCVRATFVVLTLAFALAVTGCTKQSGTETKKSGTETKQKAEAEPLCMPVPVRHYQWEERARSITASVKGIDKIVVVQIDKELDVAVQVTNFNRFKLESIQKEVGKKLKEAFPDANIHVTADKRLLKDLQRLSDERWPTDVKEACQKKKSLKEIEKKMKG